MKLLMATSTPRKSDKLDGTAGAKTAAPANNSELLEKVKSDYESYFTFIQPYRAKWRDYWKLWNNERINVQYQGDNDSFEPMTFQMVETIVDNVYGARPKLTFLPTKRDQETDTKILNGLWDASWDAANMDELIPAWGREITITGGGMLWPCMEDGLMQVKHFPMADCILDIRAAHPSKMRFAGYRRLVSLDSLKEAKWFDPTKGEIDENGQPSGQWVPRYKNLEEIPGTGGAGGDLTDAQVKEQIYSGSTLTGDKQGSQVEVIYMHYLDKVVEIANRSIIIYEGENYYHKDSYEIEVQLRNEAGELMYDDTQIPEDAAYQSIDELAQSIPPSMTTVTVPEIKPFIPVVFQREFVDPALLIAKGDVEPFATTQEELNDTLNAKKDNITYNIQNVALIDSLAKEAIPDLAQAAPGSIIPIKGLAQSEATVKWMEKPDMSTAADAEINRAKKSIRDTARVGEVVQGIDGGGNDTTATEINATIAQASSGFQTKIKGLEAGAYKQLGEMFIKLIQIFLTEEQLIRVVGKDGVEFKQFDPTKYWGPYDVKVVLEQTAKAKQKEEAQRVTDLYSLLLNDPDFNQLELKKMVLRKAFDMDDDEIELILNPNAGNMAMMGGMMGGDVTAGSPTGEVPAPGGAPAPMSPAQIPAPAMPTPKIPQSGPKPKVLTR